MEIAAVRQALETVVVVTVTPFDRAGAIDYPAYRRLIERLVAAGVSVITPNGNASEFYSLTLAEARRVMEATVEAAGGKALVLSGVGYDAVTAGVMAREAHQAGAAAVMVHQVVHPFRSAEGWVTYHQQIAEAAPDVPLVPYLRDPALTPAALSALAAACPTVAGVKFAVPEPLLFTSCVQTVGPDRWAWVCGLAELWAPFFWAGGARGFTSGLANVHPPLAQDMLKALQSGDQAEALRLWAASQPFEALRARRNSANNVSVIKEALAQQGLSGPTVRPPISELPDSERAEVRAILQAWGA